MPRTLCLLSLLFLWTTRAIAASHPKPIPNEKTFSILVVTPLLSENTFDKRFSAWGGEFLLGLPVGHVMDSVFQLEFGLGYTATRLTLSQPSTTFTHLFFFAPIRARLLYVFNETWGMDVSAGFLLRPWELDSRDTPDGGFHKVTQTSVVEPDFNLGFLYRASEVTLLRLRLGYMFLGVGVQFSL